MHRPKLFVFAIMLLLGARALHAQSSLPPVTAHYQKAALATILTDLEKQSGLRFYFDINALDTSKYDLSVDKAPVDRALSQLFQRSLMQFSIDADQNVFISRDALVKPALPEDFFDAKPKPVVSGAAPASTERTRKIDPTTLENKLYMIGSDNPKNTRSSFTVTGYVQNQKTGEAIAGAVIFLDNSSITAITDQYGYYTLSLPKGRHTITIKSIAMKQTRRQLQVQDDGKMDISLQEEIMTLSNVLVRADKTNQVRSLQMGIQKLDQATIKQVPVVFGETDVLRVAMTLPGVKTVGEASTGLNVRGGSADQNLILFNDATIYNPSHFFGLFSAFNAETVKDIQLYKSGIPVKYGGRLSSVLEVNTREGNKKNYAGSAGIGPITSRFNIEGPLSKDKSSFLFGARTTYANWLLNLLPQEYKHSKASFYDVNLTTTHELDSKNSLYLLAYVSNDGFNLNNDTSYNYGNRNFSAKWKHIVNNRWNTLLTAGYDHYHYGIGSEANPQRAYKLDFDLNQYYLKFHVNYFMSAMHSMEMGLSTLFYKLHPGSFQPVGDKSAVIPNIMEAEQALENAVYISDRYRISNEFNLEAGLRYSVFSYLGPKTINYYPAGVPVSDANRIGSDKAAGGSFVKTYHGPELRLTARY
ncbi:MAG: TonB-dependent receptor, partial [Chitinophagaceae bacterium]|nr:TonB-dependent receptor [Chitinophagaceae bacterium]